MEELTGANVLRQDGMIVIPEGYREWIRGKDAKPFSGLACNRKNGGTWLYDSRWFGHDTDGCYIIPDESYKPTQPIPASPEITEAESLESRAKSLRELAALKEQVKAKRAELEALEAEVKKQEALLKPRTISLQVESTPGCKPPEPMYHFALDMVKWGDVEFEPDFVLMYNDGKVTIAKPRKPKPRPSKKPKRRK